MARPDLEVLRSKSLTSVLQAEIERWILSGDLKSGDRVNEHHLAIRFNVSRGPIREACRALAEKGLLELTPNRGVSIRRVSRREAEELYDVRAALFALAVRLLAARITEPETAALEKLLAAMDEAAARRALEDYYPLNLRFHSLLLSYAANERLLEDYTGLVKELHLFRARGLLHGGGLEVSNVEHREIFEALRARDPLRASEAAFRHVQNGKTRMLRALDEEARRPPEDARPAAPPPSEPLRKSAATNE
jgi:DNA-binding GntR family transcriptional regulator